MKKIFVLLLIILVSITILTSCNTPDDNSGTDANSDTVTAGNEASEEASQNTETFEDAGDEFTVFASLEELSQMRAALSSRWAEQR